MTNEEITHFLRSVVYEMLLYPSLGTLPYTIIIYPTDEIAVKHSFQQKISHYIAFYFWDDFNNDDLRDFFSNTKEAQKMDEKNRKTYIASMLQKIQDPKEYELWLSKQAAMAIGMLSGRVGRNFKISIANPDELCKIEKDGIFPKKQNLSLVTVIYVQK